MALPHGAEELIDEYLASGGLPIPPAYFGSDFWGRFQYAIEYRNVLVRECTYLSHNRSPALIEACHTVLHKLAAAAGLEVIDA